MTTNIKWKDFADIDQWCAAYEKVEEDLSQIHWLKAMIGKALWCSAIPHHIHREIARVSAWTGFSVDTIMAAQVIYDEAWNLDGNYPLMGCTSVSENGAFGRNLDYGYPDNAAELVYHADIIVADKECHIEGFAGLLSFLAITDGHTAIALNQAPKTRPLYRHRTPGLLWFRERAADLLSDAEGLSNFGDVWLTDPPASDVLLHYVVGKKSFLAETYDQQMMWKRQTGKVVQVNTYQLLDVEANQWWEQESKSRAAKARAGRSVAASLKRAAVEGWTIDTIILK